MKILNLTQHMATPDQVAAGVVEPADKQLVQALLTFDELPAELDIKAKAKALAEMARHDGFDAVMIGGAPYFMSALERALADSEITALYAFSKRVSVEEPQKDGSVKKVQVFTHAGFVQAVQWGDFRRPLSPAQHPPSRRSDALEQRDGRTAKEGQGWQEESQVRTQRSLVRSLSASQPARAQ